LGYIEVSPPFNMAWRGLGRLLTLVVLLSSWACLALGLAIDVAGYSSQVAKRADPNLAGYLGAFFLGNDPYVYFYLSNGNNPLSFRALNRGAPIIRPTKGTGGVRDPTIIAGGGDEAEKKWYIIGTDLHIGKVGRAWGLSCHQHPDSVADIMGCGTANRIEGHFCLGEHRSHQLGE
jgi:hypothetical protein